MSFNLLDLYQVLTVKIREKFPLASGRVGIKSNHSETHWNILYFLTRPVLKRHYFTSTYMMGVLWEPDLGRGREILNYSPIQPSSPT